MSQNVQLHEQVVALKAKVAALEENEKATKAAHEERLAAEVDRWESADAKCEELAATVDDLLSKAVAASAE